MADTPFDFAGGAGSDALSIPSGGAASPFSRLAPPEYQPRFLESIRGPSPAGRQQQMGIFEVQKQQREAEAAAKVMQEISRRVQQQGMTPQGALVDFIQSPQGADLFAQDAGTLMKGVQQFVAGLSPENKVVPGGSTMVERNPTTGKTEPKFTAPDHVMVPIYGNYGQQIGSAVVDRTSGRVVTSTHPNIVPVGQTYQQQQQGQPGGPGAQPGAQPQQGAAPEGPLDIDRAKAAIQAIEAPQGGTFRNMAGQPTTNPYEAVGNPNKKGQRAYGKYQVMDFNIPEWTKAATGTALTPAQFVQNPDAQERVFERYFGDAYRRTGSAAQAASIWFTGRANAPLAKDVNGMTGQGYVDRFNQVYGQAPGAASPGAPTAQPAQDVAPVQQPGRPPAPGIPGQGAPGQRPSYPPYVPQRLQTPASPPSETGLKTLWSQIPLSTGVIPGVLSGAQRITGQFGVDVLPKEVSQARIAFRDATNNLIKATALNPRFIGAEQDRLRTEFSFAPGFFTDERTLSDRIIYMDDKATQEINQLNKEWEDPRTPMERQKEIANAIQAFRQFKDRLGVPPVGHPDRENPPRSTFKEQVEMGKKAVGAVKKGAGEAKRDAMGAKPNDLGTMSLDELARQPGITPEQKRRLDALRGR